MKTFFTIVKTEARMQLRRPFLWAALVLINALANAETFPHAANLNRLASLDLSSYAAMRQLLMAMPVAGIVAAIFSAGRMRMDRDLSMAALIWTAERPGALSYSLGKWLGSLLALSLLPLSLVLSGWLVRMLLMPQAVEASDYLAAWLVLGLLPLAYIIALSLLGGESLGVRLTHILVVMYIFWGLVFPGVDDYGVINPAQFMGSLQALIFIPVGWPFPQQQLLGAWITMAFEAGCTLAALGALVIIVSFRRKAGHGNN
jgi:hypothetical protein